MAYLPQNPASSTIWATVLSINGDRVTLDAGDPADPLVDVGTFGQVPAVGDRVMVLLQGRAATVLPPPAAENHTHPAVVTGEWRYSTNDTMADPGSGYLRVSTAADQIAISYTSNLGADSTTYFKELSVGDTIRVQDKDDAAVYRTFELTGGTDNGTWALLDVVVTSPTIEPPPRNNEPALVTARIGVQGGGDGGYVKRSGDTMTGDLILPGVPDGASKQFRSTTTVGPTESWDAAVMPGVWKHLKQGSEPDGPGDGYYYHLMVIVYGGADDLQPDHDKNLIQIAWPYGNTTAPSPKWRGRYNGAWTAWSSLISSLSTERHNYAAGTIAVASSASPSYLTYDVTFPVGRFTSAPAVVVTPGSGRLNATAYNITSAGFTAGFNNWSGGTASASTAQWIAQRK